MQNRAANCTVVIVTLLAVADVMFIGSAAGTVATAASPAGAEALKDPSAFTSIDDPRARSAALFVEVGKVINSPRCLNCHPAARSPTQGNDLHAHVPFINAGQAGHGQRGLSCRACHQAVTVDTQASSIASIPGHAHWGLAPESMAWQGKTLAQICQQIKDGDRNGGRNLAQISEHMRHDSLVGWAWHPGAGRTPAPGTQEQFGRLVQAWIATGAFCPA